jgi:hypothetical protein
MEMDSETRLSEGMQTLFSTPIWKFFFPQAEAINPILSQAILEAA